jgi:CDP-6-deoxy-D-xylo-4-hexulose-3-dehydrase
MKIKNKVYYAKTSYDSKEINAVIKVLKEQKLNLMNSKNVKKFESKIARLFDKKYGLMVNSCSSANLLALSALNLPKGSEIITPCLTFSTTISPIIQLGLIPSLVDINLDTLLINEDCIEEMITKKTRAMIIPNLIGNIPNLIKIKKICKKYNLYFIEDSADTIDSFYSNKRSGSYSDISTTSFYASHVITCAGSGGMLCTNNEKFYKKALIQRGWGRNSTLFGENEDVKYRFKSKNSYDEKYLFTDLGYNFIPTEISAAFGLEQLKKLKKLSLNRKKNFKILHNFFSKKKKYFKVPSINKKVDNIWLAFPLLVNTKKFTRNELQIFLEKNNIQTRTIFTGNIMKQPGYINQKFKKNKFGYSNSDYVMENGILLGCHQSMKKKEIEYMIFKVNEFLDKH